jgi:hypothetical protein
MINKTYPYFVSAIETNPIIDDNELGQWVRLINPHESELAVLNSLLKSNVRWFENATGYQIAKANYEWITSTISDEIPKKPYFGSLIISYLKEDFTGYEVIDSTNYRVVKASNDVLKIVFHGTKPSLVSAIDAVKVSFVAGWEISNIPADIIEVLKLRTGGQFEDRGDSPDELNRLSETMIEAYLPPQVA